MHRCFFIIQNQAVATMPSRISS